MLVASMWMIALSRRNGRTRGKYVIHVIHPRSVCKCMERGGLPVESEYHDSD